MDGKYKEYELNSDFRKNKDFPAKLLRGIIEVSLRLLFASILLWLFIYVVSLPQKTLFQANLAYCSEKDRVTNERLVEPLMSLVKSYEGGRASHARVVVKSLFEEYLSVEELFCDNIQITI